MGIKEGISNLKNKAAATFTPLTMPKAESTGFLRGDLAEAAYSLGVDATVFNISNRFREWLQAVETNAGNSFLKAKKILTTKITSPVELGKNILQATPGFMNEMADLAGTSVGRISQGIETFVGGAGRAVDLVSRQVREKISMIPGLGTITKIGTGAINVANNLTFKPVEGILKTSREKVGGALTGTHGWIRTKLDMGGGGALAQAA